MPTIEADGKRARLLALYRERGFAFVHVPKTGGYSLTAALMDGIATEHASAICLRAQLGSREWDRLLSFAFLRHPASRFLSAFWYLKAGGMNAQDRAWAETHLRESGTAEDFVHLLERQPSLLSWVHFRPQWTFVCDTSGAVLVDFLGRFERFDEDVQVVLRRLKWQGSGCHQLRSGAACGLVPVEPSGTEQPLRSGLCPHQAVRGHCLKRPRGSAATYAARFVRQG